jgi:NifU-like protein involved in Fe-S cluster formation
VTADIGPAYRAALAGRRIAHEGQLDQADGMVLVEATDGATLMLRVRPADHVIEAAAHRGTAGPVARAVLDALCAEIEGLPMQEASDHGAIRLEFALRDKAAIPVPGIVTPGGADRAFAVAEALLRRAVAAYREQTGYDAIDNDFDAGPAAAWRALPRRARLDRLMSACAEVCRAAGWPADAVAVADIEYDVRVVVELRGPLASGEGQAHLMRLERAIKDRVDGRLELYLAERNDANVLRRLSEKKVA